jgi:hypothetical protein
LLNALHQYFFFRIFAPQLILDHQVLFATAYKALILISIRVPGAICEILNEWNTLVHYLSRGLRWSRGCGR